MSKLVYSASMMCLLVLATYLTCLTATLSLKETAFVGFLVVVSMLVLIMLWRPTATIIMFPALVATLSALSALAHLSGTSFIIQHAFPALIVVVAIWTAVQLNLRLWKVLLCFVLLTSAIYFSLVGFPAGFFHMW